VVIFKRALAFSLALLLFWMIVDQFLCDRWMYHDYATGSDKRLICPW